MATGAHNVRKGHEFERWLATHYGKAEGHAVRTGFVVEKDGRQSGVDVRLDVFGLQAKKGKTAVSKTITMAMAAATRHAGRHVPAVVLASDGDNLGHYVVLRGSDFKKIVDLLNEVGISERLLVGAGWQSEKAGLG